MWMNFGQQDVVVRRTIEKNYKFDHNRKIHDPDLVLLFERLFCNENMSVQKERKLV